MKKSNIEVLRKILYAVESGGQVYGRQNYAAFAGAGANCSNEKAITIGAGQWYAGEAKRLLQKIQRMNPAQFKKMDTQGIATELLKKDWSTYAISPTSAKAKCIVAIISSALGRKCQDELMDEQITEYAASITKTYGTMTDGAMMECINIIHQGGSSALKRILAKTAKPYTAKTIYAALCTDPADPRTNQVGDYAIRQKKVYEFITKYASDATTGATASKENRKEETTVAITKEQIIQNIRNDAVDFAVGIANDNSHGYSQTVRSLYNITSPKSFDCSSLVLTSYYYAFLKNGLTDQANYLKKNCSYTGNMLKMLNVGFEVVARCQTAHAQMIKGDVELADNNSNGSNSHTALAVDKNNIVHSRSSEGTRDTRDNSGNEIRTQPWYLYSHGWTHRLRFTGRGIDFSKLTNTSESKPTATITKGDRYMFEPKTVELGSKGTSVLLLQEILVARDFRGADNQILSLDRVAGENTICALNSYKKSRNMKQDGICDAAVWKDLLAI